MGHKNLCGAHEVERTFALLQLLMARSVVTCAIDI
jgi:hypothetical protein